jgi:hypothetical protein
MKHLNSVSIKPAAAHVKRKGAMCGYPVCVKLQLVLYKDGQSGFAAAVCPYNNGRASRFDS